MEIKECELNSIQYYNESKDEHSTRVVIPSMIPSASFRAIDVSDLNNEARQEMQQLYSEYKQYYKDQQSTIFNFETWVDHSKNRTVTPKWRTFKLNNIQLKE